jgi:hypothetical protein
MFTKHARKVASFLGMAFMLALFLPKLALADDDDDPPSVVARLAYAQGSVSFQPGGTDDWVAAVVNRPITTGDKLWSDNDGRVELQLDASSIRLSNNTGFSFLNLGDNITQVRLTEGTLNIRVRNLEGDETYEIDTPNLAFSITRPGVYRVTVNEGGDSTDIVVRSGEGQVTGGGSSYSVRANDDAVFEGTDQLSADVQDYSGNNDDFDNWSTSRDQHYEHSKSSQYVSDDVVGSEDLDDHGDWDDTPDYGHVWYPRVTVTDWAPYHYGHWAYIEPWGYTWVDDQPWGFAPFHYGRWVSVRGRWGWIPAPRRVVGVAYVRPVYAPALVAFVGGGGFSVGVAVGGGGNVGWFPLGPREVYVPSYRVSPRYVERVNISNTTVNRTVVNNYYNTTIINKQVTNITYVNQRVPGAVMATSRTAFTSAQPVSRNVVRVDQRELASARVEVRQPTIVPTRQAVLGTGRAATVRPPAAIQARAVVAKAAPPPPPPSFEKRQEAIKSNGGRPLSTSQIRQIQPAPAAQAQAAVRVAPPPKQPVVSVRQAPKPAQPVNRPAAQGNVAGRPGQPQPGQPNNNPANRPATVAPNAQQQNQNRPGQPLPNQPNAAQPGNRPNDRPVTQPNTPQPGNRPADRPATAQPNTAQPGNRPNDRPVTQPNAPQPGNRPADRPNTAQPPPNRNDRPADRPATAQPNTAQPGNRPTDRPATPPNTPPPGNRPADRPADRPNATPPNNRPVDRPVTQPNTAQPGNRPTDRPADRPNAAEPNNRPADRPADRPAARPAERPAERPAPRPAERPADRPADRPAARPDERPAERPAPRAQERQKETPKEKEKDKPPKDKEKPPKG